jgi:glycosyltransferase involved in cell wall biosynthesis
VTIERRRPAMRILIVSDAWYPQINGVVRTLSTVAGELRLLGHDVSVIGPDRFRTIPCPTYPDIRLAVDALGKLPQLIRAFEPDAIHISTEGPLGFAARRYCRRNGLAFTTAYHTKFPEYIQARTRIPPAWIYRLIRPFHAAAARVMVSTGSIEAELRRNGFDNIVRWSRGVDTGLFRPRDKSFLGDPRPIALYVGRVAVEKNIAAFLDLPFAGTKYVVGDGPQLRLLRRRYPGVRFVGMKTGEDLANYYAASDVFVFPSRTDTFGLVLLEALASGIPVAAYPVAGPLDVIGGAPVGCLDEDLAAAVAKALTVQTEACRAHALNFSWRASAEQFLRNLVPAARNAAAPAATPAIDPPAAAAPDRAQP